MEATRFHRTREKGKVYNSTHVSHNAIAYTPSFEKGKAEEEKPQEFGLQTDYL